MNRMLTGPGSKAGKVAAAGALTVAACFAVLPSSAQDPGPQGPNRPPITFGSVASVDSSANTVSITNPSADTSTVLKIDGSTDIESQTTVPLSNIKVGDKVEVRGVPTGIRAESLIAGTAPELFPGRPGGGPGGPGGGFGGPGGRPGGPGGPGGGPGGRPGINAMATGTVTRLSPLTIEVSSDVSVIVKLKADARVTRWSPLKIGDIKVGDRIAARGNQDGTSVDATIVIVNPDMRMMGGFGMRGGNADGGWNGGGQGRRRGQWNGGGNGGWNRGQGRDGGPGERPDGAGPMGPPPPDGPPMAE